MKKRIISLLLALVLAATLLPVQAWGATVVDSGYCGGEGDGKNLTWSLDSDGLLTISGEGKMEDFRKATTISWWEQHSDIRQVSIAEGVTSIGDYSFWACSNLVNVEIPDTATSIGYRAFAGCDNLDSIKIPDSVTVFGRSTFEGSGIAHVELPNQMQHISDNMFWGCDNLVTIKIPGSVTTIGKKAFFGSSNLTNVVLPFGITTIGTDAFRGCHSLSNMIIPNSVTSIGSLAFVECYAFTSITIPSSVTNIESNTFNSCLNMTNITIPNSLISIGNWAFSGCNHLTDVYYTGSEAEWNAIQIGSNGNEPLTSATIHYNSSGPQGDDGESSSIYNKKPTDLALTVYENKKESNVRETDYRLSSGATVSCGSDNGTTGKTGRSRSLTPAAL